MFALCVESSHARGMGHLYRALNFIDYLAVMDEPYIVIINENEAATCILREKGVDFERAELSDLRSDWETRLIKKHGVDVWIDDRLDTEEGHARNVKKNGTRLVTFDDRGSGAELADLNVAALSFGNEKSLKGARILVGVKYLILNKAIQEYRRVRKKAGNIIISLGGSDTYGVTLKIIDILKNIGKKATVHTGPSFRHRAALETIVNEDFPVIDSVNSLAESFYSFDLAVTGGGITPFEANASGLPCIIIANEVFEVENGRFLQSLGSSVFAGYHEDIEREVFGRELDIETMSARGIEAISLNGAENVYACIKELS